MPLNYSKWDQLELSDDSDIEGHPNVDKKSLIRWKQRDIHEKRGARKHHIAQLRQEIALNDILIPRIANYLSQIRDGGPAAYSKIVEKLRTDPSPEAPPTGAPNQPTYDAMLLQLLMKVFDEVKAKGINKGDDGLAAALVAQLEEHDEGLRGRQEDTKQELDKELDEQSKHITSEDIHDGWDSKYVPPKPEPAPLVATKPEKKTKAVKETQYEVLNAPSSADPAPPSEVEVTDNDDDTDDDEATTIPGLTPDLLLFSKLQIGNYQQSFNFIQANRSVVVEGAIDALFLAAYEAEGRGESQYSKQCVHQALLLQYCEKLGKDGVRLFFQRMVSGDPRAAAVFVKDVDDTYAHLAKRVALNKVEENREQIQLVAEDPSTVISFNVPDGPPPEELVLEGPGTEDLDIEEVRKALQFRWDVFQGFSNRLQKALQSNQLEKVNEVLGKMEVPEAEDIVQLLESAGILNFADGGQIRDETGSS